jgi:hypothetical protein
MVAQIAVGQASGRDAAFRIESRLDGVLQVDVRPPRLRVADEVDLWILRQHRAEALEAIVVHVELPVHQHRNAEGLRQLIDFLHGRRVALYPELLLADEHRAALQVPLDLRNRILQIRHFIGA